MIALYYNYMVDTDMIESTKQLPFATLNAVL